MTDFTGGTTWTGGDIRHRVLYESPQASFQMRLIEVPGSDYSALERAQADLCLMVLSGSGRIRVDAVTHDVRADDVVAVSRESVYQVSNPYSDLMRVLCVGDPGAGGPIQ